MILTYFFHQTLNRCFSYIRSKENKIRNIWSLKVYSKLKEKGYVPLWVGERDGIFFGRYMKELTFVSK